MRRMTEERQITLLDGIGEAVKVESAGTLGKKMRDRLDSGVCRSLVFRVVWVDIASCSCEWQRSE
jgi:hypothetical protein